MKGTILEKIVEAKRVRVEAAKTATDKAELTEKAAAAHATAEPHRLRSALSDRGKINIIAEYKKASPSKGIIKDGSDPAVVARAYESGGAAAISVLTEEDYFKGSLYDLRAVRSAVSLPILR